uniref:Uncharacterized protein n=1 Tax=Aegilops tauschii subsp. strangulata TaxID=200361 RepID=A0A453Q5T9_AEGTS
MDDYYHTITSTSGMPWAEQESACTGDRSLRGRCLYVDNSSVVSQLDLVMLSEFSNVPVSYEFLEHVVLAIACFQGFLLLRRQLLLLFQLILKQKGEQSLMKLWLLCKTNEV